MQPIARVGPYDLIRPLGAGGMAETFVAVRRGPEGFEQKVCLKRILQGHTAEPSFIELFLDEARLLAQLRCGGIVQVYDFGAADGTYYMALELVDGADLDALVDSLTKRGTRLPAEVALFIAMQVLQALDYAHSVVVDGHPLNIVHRDISPSNILVSMHGEVKLTDFGIAKSRGRKHKTQTGHTKGKVAYMSPEQVRGEELDARSDLFAVGVLLYEMLTGTHPFYAPTDLTLLNNILSGKRRPLSELLPDASPSVVALVDALLRVDAKDRPASAGDALREVAMQEQPFSLQRKLASLMVEYRASAPARAQSARPTPAPSDGGTAILPPGKTPADRMAFVETRDLDRGAAGTDGSRAAHLVRDASRQVDVSGLRKAKPWVWVAGAALMLSVLVFAGLMMRGEETLDAAQPQVGAQLPTKNQVGAPPPALPVAPVRNVDPVEPAVEKPTAPEPVVAPEVMPQPVELHRPEKAELESSSRSRRQRGSTTKAPETKPEPTPSAKESAKTRARSGVPVSTDDF